MHMAMVVMRHCANQPVFCEKILIRQLDYDQSLSGVNHLLL